MMIIETTILHPKEEQINQARGGVLLNLFQETTVLWWCMVKLGQFGDYTEHLLQSK